MGERRHRVLIVDDNIEMARSIADGLVDRGFDTLAAGSGPEARRLLQTEAFDAVVTELRIPEIDGLQILSLARELDPARPVIVMTDYSALEGAIESLRQGAHHYLTKPFKQEELVIFLGRALDEVRVRREASALKGALLEHFLREARARHPHSPVRGFSPAALDALVRSGWPGDVLELAQTIEEVVLLGKGQLVALDDLPTSLWSDGGAPLGSASERPLP